MFRNGVVFSYIFYNTKHGTGAQLLRRYTFESHLVQTNNSEQPLFIIPDYKLKCKY